MKRNSPLSLFFFFLLAVNITLAQKSNEKTHSVTIKIPEVALINVQSTNSTINLNGSTVVEAGKEVVFNDVDSSTWINYSSIVGSASEPLRHVTIEISEGNIPEGLNLLVKVEKDNGSGDGNLGNPNSSSQIITNSPLKIIEEIGSSYTGVGVNKGHNVLYSLELSNNKDAYSKLDFDQSQTIAIVYTLSDN